MDVSFSIMMPLAADLHVVGLLAAGPAIMIALHCLGLLRRKHTSTLLVVGVASLAGYFIEANGLPLVGF